MPQAGGPLLSEPLPCVFPSLHTADSGFGVVRVPCVPFRLTPRSCVVSSSLAGSALKRLCLGKEHSSSNYPGFLPPLSPSPLIAWASLWLVRARVLRPDGLGLPPARSVPLAGQPGFCLAGQRPPALAVSPWLLEFVQSRQFASDRLPLLSGMPTNSQSLIGSFSKTVGMSISLRCKDEFPPHEERYQH